VEELEVQILYDDFRNSPQRRLATRTPGVFLAALTVALLGMLVARLTGEVWLALLVPAVYATGPEVFVRSAYGGYFAISMFALVQILLAVEERVKADCPAAWRDCLLAGTFAAVANHKLVFLPIAVVVWEILRLAPAWNEKKAVRALFSPVAVGFAAGTLLFWAYGLATQPGAFWVEHVRGHLVDRVIHHNPLSYTGYPGWVGLWFEFWQHTGYLLLPLGIVALVFLCIARPAGDEEPSTVGWRGTAGLWAVWMLLVAVAFTLVDWRQTKHLMRLLLPLHLSLARWAATSRKLLIVVGLLLLCLLAWNLDSLQALAAWFEGFTVTPAW